MLKRIFVLLLLFEVTAFCSTASGQTTYLGGRGMLRVFSAEVVRQRAFYLNYFTQTYIFQRSSGTNLGKDYTMSVGLTYGLKNNLELTAQVVPYQDDQRSPWGPPGDTQIGIKWRLPFSSNSLVTGLRGFFSFPTARRHNVAFEPFSSGKVAWGFMGLVTLDLTEVLPRAPVKLHFNLGYLDHDIGTPFGNTLTDQIQLGLGFKILVKSVVLYSEYTAEIFHQINSITYRNNSMRFTQGVKFPGPLNLLIDFGFDIGLHNFNTPPNAPLHEYADWKFIFGFTHQFRKYRVKRTIPRAVNGTSDSEKEMLEEIKKKRERVAEELEKLRKKLEEDSEEEPP